jgi:hypothetical protein
MQNKFMDTSELRIHELILHVVYQNQSNNFFIADARYLLHNFKH